MATIATHNGSRVAREHNRRNPKVCDKESHISQNGYFEVWLDESPKIAYERIFGEAVADYNSKQKRADRRVDNYYKQICKDEKKHPVYEMIVGVYDKSISFNTKREILKEFADTWKERNPNLELIGLYFHADEEGDIHLHIDYIPVARGLKRGMKTQNSLTQALKQQGIVSGETMKETAQILWERKENQYLENLCLARGITVDHPMKKQKEAKHIETQIFKKTCELESLYKEMEALIKDMETLEEDKEFLNSEIEKLANIIFDNPQYKLERVESYLSRNGAQNLWIGFLKEEAKLKKDAATLVERLTNKKTHKSKNISGLYR